MCMQIYISQPENPMVLPFKLFKSSIVSVMSLFILFYFLFIIFPQLNEIHTHFSDG